MVKPDDIPQDIWETAKGWASAETLTTCGQPRLTSVIARAILAERVRHAPRGKEAW